MIIIILSRTGTKDLAAHLEDIKDWCLPDLPLISEEVSAFAKMGRQKDILRASITLKMCKRGVKTKGIVDLTRKKHYPAEDKNQQPE